MGNLNICIFSLYTYTISTLSHVSIEHRSPGFSQNNLLYMGEYSYTVTKSNITHSYLPYIPYVTVIYSACHRRSPRRRRLLKSCLSIVFTYTTSQTNYVMTSSLHQLQRACVMEGKTFKL